MRTAHSPEKVTEATLLLSGLLRLPRGGAPPLSRLPLPSGGARGLGGSHLPQRIQLAIDRFPQLERIGVLIELLQPRLLR
jgi:hypothetical protein